jgi:16S rRNA (cytosine967-C5)-methyltransferase
MSNELLSRKAVFLILEKALNENNTLESSFENVVERFAHNLSAQDRRFIRHLTTTILRRLGQLDGIINRCTKKKLTDKQLPVRHVLRMGIAQLIFMDVPAHAAVNTSVSLMDKVVNKNLGYLKNSVNAILRNVDRERDFLIRKFNNTRLNIPHWMRDSWDQRFGQPVVKEILSAMLGEPPLDIVLKPELDEREWAQKLKGETLPTGGIRLYKAGKINELEGFDEGAWWVQDIAATLPVKLMNSKHGDVVLDLCAAPGGKAAQSAAKGARVIAVDASENRLRRLQENMDRLNFEVDVVQSDILKYQPDHKFDYIILDAPCSSTGTIRRHPEILHSRSPSDVKDMIDIQVKMLDHASSLLNPGGILIYSVCSMESGEGPDQIKALLERDGSLKREKITKQELSEFEQAILETGDVQTLPHYYEGGMDGFFISRMIKN